MSKEMPRFAMPPAAPEASSARAAPTRDTASLTADGSSGAQRGAQRGAQSSAQRGAQRDGSQQQRGGFGWRHLLILGLVCALIGGAIPLAIQAAERAAATAKVDGLRAVAQAYLSAIELGRWEEATSLVPTSGSAQLAPIAVLDSARRIENAEVVLAHVDGDVGAVQVRYRVDARDISRLLEAEHVNGSWRITTSLAELPSIANYDGVSIPEVAGVGLGRPSPLLLYPGSYALDTVQSPIYEHGGDGFVIDGEIGTVTEVGTTLRLSHALLDQASARAIAHASLCQSTGACAWSERIIPTSDGPPYSTDVRLADRLTVQVPLVARSGSFNEHVGVEVVLTVDGAGTVEAVTCSGLQGFSEEPIDCMG